MSYDVKLRESGLSKSIWVNDQQNMAWFDLNSLQQQISQSLGEVCVY